jgi:hypothetical protein
VIQNREFRQRRADAQIAERALQVSLVQSISDEIEGIWKLYNVQIGPELESLNEGQAASVFPVGQSYFVIFDASAASIGRLPNADLRTKIIQFYIGAKSMVDSLQHYGGIVRGFAEANINLVPGDEDGWISSVSHKLARAPVLSVSTVKV